MKPFLGAFVSLVLVCLGEAGARGESNQLPEKVSNILNNAEQFVVLSLDPMPEKETTKDGFHGYKILGKTTVKGDVRKELLVAFLKGMEGNLVPAKCFEPNHGIRATHNGQTVEIVICFTCSQIRVYVGSEETGLLIGQKPAAAFDKVLKDAGIPKAK